MRLKKLTIIGFKSFADRVHLDFDAEVIAVVGPNGCGKSNIVDAFRWVMGEQSAKSLRGSSMEDVLFAGTDKRKPIHFAEVSVTLTETSEIVPLGADEITITRRLYRSGESEYLLNKEVVRLKDIQGLLMGTGMGKQAFSIFEQGKLDQVINLSPMERRGIFDEAAGIGRFLQRKKESVKRLSEVAENYDKVRGIHAEVETQVKQLKKQAAEAKSFQEKKERLETLEKGLLVLKWQKMQAQVAAATVEHATLLEEINKKRGALEEEREAFLLAKAGVEERTKSLRTLQEKSYQLASDRKIQEAERERRAAEREELAREEKRLLTELEELSAGRQEALTQAKEAEKAFKHLQKEKERVGSAVDTKRSHHLQLEITVKQLRDELRALQQSVLQATNLESRLAKELQEKELKAEHQAERLKQLHLSIEERLRVRELLNTQREERKKRVAELSEAIDGLRAAKGELDSKLETLRRTLAEKHKEKEALFHQIADCKAKEKALLGLQASLEGFSQGAKRLLKEAEREGGPLFGKIRPLFSALSVKSGGEKMVATALRPYQEALALSSQKDLEEVLAFAKEHKLEEIIFVVVPEEKSSAGLAALLEEGSAPPFMHKIEVVEVLKKTSSITKNGDYIDPQGVLFFSPTIGKEKNAFMRAAELKTLQGEIKKLESARVAHEKVMDGLYRERAQSEERKKGLDEEVRKAEIGLVQENFSLQRTLKDLESEERSLCAIEEEKQKLLKNTEGAELELKECHRRHEEAKRQSLRCHKHIQEKEGTLEEQLRSLEEALRSFKTEESALQNILLEWQKQSQIIALYETKDLENQKLSKKHSEMLFVIKERKLTSEKQFHTASAAVLVRVDEIAEIAASLQAAEREVQVAKAHVETLDKRHLEKQKESSRLEEKGSALAVSLASKEAFLLALAKESAERYELSPEKLQETIPHFDRSIEDVEKEVREVQRAVERGGLVNLKAIEECKEREERFQTLDRQLSDLLDAKTDLEKIIGELERESRKLFKATFERIRAHFQKNFAILFNGGEADLKYTESTDVLEAGIEIFAKPPGKQMRSISLLSGGEKCLTAIALLFSIFEEKPAPFCILDEVDAPLDDTNVGRFTTVLQQYVDKTQFIIVTHNKKTMGVADLLFGVSMEERGVSKVLSLNFNKELAYADRHS